MKNNITSTLFIALLCFLHGCVPEENESIDTDIQEVELNSVNSKFASSIKPLPLSIKCPKDNTLTLFIRYKKFTSETDKIRIRKKHEKYYTIFEVIESNECNRVELWKVDCSDYKYACQRKCHVEEEIEVPRIVSDDFPFPPYLCKWHGS